MRRAKVALSGTEQETLQRFGEFLRRARLRRNLSQAEMAIRTGVTRNTYAALEVGSVHASLGLLVRVMEILGYPKRVSGLLEHDPIGDDIVAPQRQRAGGRHDLADF